MAYALSCNSGQFSIFLGVTAQLCVPAPPPSHPCVCQGSSGGFANQLPPTYTLDLTVKYR